MKHSNNLLEKHGQITMIEPSHFNISSKKNKILSNRSDGLGERLMSLLNGMIISKYLNYEFAYVWENEISFSDLKTITNQPNIINHAIAPENSVIPPFLMGLRSRVRPTWPTSVWV